jgi:hypothetical protein
METCHKRKKNLIGLLFDNNKGFLPFNRNQGIINTFLQNLVSVKNNLMGLIIEMAGPRISVFH